MGNLSSSLKKFLQNKNTVTVVGVVLAVVVLYVAYNMRVKSAINPVTVPYAVQNIAPGTQITSSMVGTRQVPPSMLEGEVLTRQGDVIDKYSSADTVIPKGSLFYKRTVVEKEQLPANIILDYPKGDELFNLDVSTNSTYGNSVYPGNYIDIWLKAINRVSAEQAAQGIYTEDANKVIYSKLLKNVKVLAVKDSSGKAVFSNLDEDRKPAMVIFSVPADMFVLLRKAENMQTYQTSLEIVPTNESLKEQPGEAEVSSEKMKEWINRNTVWDETLES